MRLDVPRKRQSRVERLPLILRSSEECATVVLIPRLGGQGRGPGAGGDRRGDVPDIRRRSYLRCRWPARATRLHVAAMIGSSGAGWARPLDQAYRPALWTGSE